MYNILPFVIILISLAVILWIVLKKMPYLASLDIKEMPKEKAAETKEKIMEERLQRKLKYFYGKIAPLGKLVFNLVQRKTGSAVTRLKELEEKYKGSAKKESLVTKKDFENLEKKMASFLKEADNMVEKEDYEQAEKKYLEIISLMPRNIEAFRGLGNLYFLQKSYNEAQQTFEHILKINKEDDKAFCQLAETLLKFDDCQGALNNIDSALEIAPNNPKYLDLLIKISIMVKDKEKAVSALNKLKSVNPENQRIGEFEGKLREI